SILSWYDRTRPMFIDLVGDYAGKELFLIDGDSLLRECFEDDRIDFNSGYQILHVVYVVERFLENLVKRHCSFHIAFIEARSPLEDTDLEGLASCPSGITTSESYYLTSYAISEILDNDEYGALLSSAFVLHSITLKHVPLSARRLPVVTFDKDFEHEIDGFLSDLSSIFQNTLASEEWKDFALERKLEIDIADLIDGRVFRAVIRVMCESTIEEQLPAAAKQDWKLMSRIVRHLADEELSMKAEANSKPTDITAEVVEDAPKHALAVLPFSHEVFDEHLKCIHVTADTSVQAKLGAMKLYRETTHWHNYNKPLNPKTLPVAKVSKWRNPLRTNQFYMNEMTAYAASLSGAKGKALDAETITVGPKQLMKIVEDKPAKGPSSKKDDSQAQKGAAGKKGTKKAAAGLSMKEQIITNNEARRGGSETDKAFSAWAMKKKDFDLIRIDQERYLRTDEYLNSLDPAKTNYLEGEINAYVLQCLLGWWSEVAKTLEKSRGYHIVALIWTRIRTICNLKSPFSKEIVPHITKVCALLGISDAFTPIVSTVTDRKLSFVFKYPAQTTILKIEMTPKEFQLNHVGPYMDRMLDAKPDPRVSSFVPDGWQREVLDQLDANKSVFVVAPTSAGKTFISFYAMEQVLRADNDGVLVYVAPTKALVNQIAAEIQGRFSKKFLLGGKGVWAIHTRDYRVNNPTGCQILVTVPHILQIMLLSPSNSKSWAPRVRRIIFDEIHSIGQAEDGVVWEQLLLLAPCPIIALSATVGNPDSFNEWLIETQKATGTELKMIQHHTRYSDLRKYFYNPPKTFQFKGFERAQGFGLGLDDLVGFEDFHPVASLVDHSRGIPDDLALEPRDCLSLWNAMVKCQTDKYKVPASLDPVKSLPTCVRKVDIFKWEKDLKKLLGIWMQDIDSPFDKVVSLLSPKVQDGDPPESPGSPTMSTGLLDFHDLKSTTLPLLYQLHSRKALPAILFNYDRSECENIAFALLSQLASAEAKWKEGPQWKKLMDGYEKYKEQKDKKSKKPVKPVKKSKDDDDEGGSKMDRMRDEASDGSSIYDLFDPEAPQADFSFADPKRLPKADLDGFIKALRWKGIDEQLIELLKRGVGVHHAGMNRKYRQCVEMLFRKGFLRVVIATGTLSMGINMPCATVVFSGDSVFLTALNFRQAAGRSGRRGFDLLGNVVFQGISRERASRLLSSKLPELTGHFPITTTLVLRLFSMLHGSGDSKYAKKAVNSLLSQPRLYLGGQSFKEQVLHHLRFSIEYLRRNGLLGPAGQPVNFTSCVSHLYFTENSSFAFHALLKGGYFQELCADIETKPTKILEEMVLVLSHLFGQRVCREVDNPEEVEKILRSQSKVYLPDMPEAAKKILRKHNEDTLDIFTTYVKTFASQHVKKAESSLPLTRTRIGAVTPMANGQKPANGSTNANGALTPVGFLPSLPAPDARSAFVALSGLGDDFTTIEDLCSSTREGVFLEAAVIPHLQIYPDDTRTKLNAYLLDFYIHGAVQPLEEANGIRKSDVWFVLNDFSMILATITTSIALHLGLNTDSDPEMLDIMGSGDTIENDNDEQVAANSAIPETSAKIGTPIQPPPVVRKGKKVVEDWDASADQITAEEDYLKSVEGEGATASEGEEYEKLMNVYKAFKKLKTDFDEKFRAIWA
ncbi:hypothetical protein BJ875DRAFT_524841, partial [Amylocarpus encephaloides]